MLIHVGINGHCVLTVQHANSYQPVSDVNNQSAHYFETCRADRTIFCPVQIFSNSGVVHIRMAPTVLE